MHRENLRRLLAREQIESKKYQPRLEKAEKFLNVSFLYRLQDIETNTNKEKPKRVFGYL